MTNRRPPGASWYVALILLGLAILLLADARTSEFRHGEELVWLIANLVPGALARVSLILAAYHLARGRLRSWLSWIPVPVALALLVWVFAYVFLDAFR